MISLTTLPKYSVNDAEKVEHMRLLIVQAIDNLEQMVRVRELTNQIWDINSTYREENWDKTSVLLESYEENRDESLESALSTLRELAGMINGETLLVESSADVGLNINIGVATINAHQSIS